MTMGEFARKYGIAYHEVQRASFRTAARSEASWRLDFEERDLLQAMREELRFRVEYHAGLAERARDLLGRLEGGAEA